MDHGETLVTKQESIGIEPPINTVVIRHFFPDKMVMTLQCEEVISVVHFVRLNKETLD